MPWNKVPDSGEKGSIKFVKNTIVAAIKARYEIFLFTSFRVDAANAKIIPPIPKDIDDIILIPNPNPAMSLFVIISDENPIKIELPIVQPTVAIRKNGSPTLAKPNPLLPCIL